MFKKIIYILPIIFLITSCAGTIDSVKRGITGEKQKSTDEFFIQKKDPLILPPDYENLPAPDETVEANKEEISIFKNTSEESTEVSSSNSSSVEDSVLRRIRSK